MHTDLQFGFDEKQLSAFILGCNPDLICRDVVIAPCWSPASVGVEASRMEPLSASAWNFCWQGREATYLISGVGAGRCSDLVMALRSTACSRIILIGSAGSIDPALSVGDLFFPTGVITGDGLCRYLSSDLTKDPFGEEQRTSPMLQAALYRSARRVIQEQNLSPVTAQTGLSASVETLFSQFQHISWFEKKLCRCLDMEAAAAVCSAAKIGAECAVAFVISDNVKKGQSLVTISEADTAFRKAVRLAVVPALLSTFLETGTE